MTELEMTNPEIPADPDPLDAWERWWNTIGETPGEIVWDAHEGDLEADLGRFADRSASGCP
jgi:hypothetical protein